MRDFIKRLKNGHRILIGLLLIMVYNGTAKLYYPERLIFGILAAILFMVFLIFCLTIKYENPEEKRPSEEEASNRLKKVQEMSAEDRKAIEVYEEILSRDQLIKPAYIYKDQSDIGLLESVVAGYDGYIAFLSNIEITESFSALLQSKVERDSLGRYKIPELEVEMFQENDIKDANTVLQEKIKIIGYSRAHLLNRLSFLKKCDSVPCVEINIADKESKQLSSRIVSGIPFSNITKKTRLEKVGNFVAFDVETTGLSVSKNEIVEISAIRFQDFKPVEAFSTLCKPKKGICDEASKINGITEDMVEGKPTFGQIASSFQDFIGSDNLIAHNLEFDLKFVVKYGVDVLANDRKYYDTLDIAQRTLKKCKKKWDKEFECNMDDLEGDYDVMNYKLETLCDYYGIALSGAHRAIADCMATGMLFEHLCLDRTE